MKQSAAIKARTPKSPKQNDECDKKTKKSDRTIQVSGSAVNIQIKADDPRTLGSTSQDFQYGFASQLLNITTQGKEPDEDAASFAVAVINSMEPQNELEAMLGAQMVAIHNASMTMARRLAHVDTVQQQDSAERALNKLTRTYAMQLQALRKYRSGGKQQVTVKHVHVNEGGQAIVGNVATGGPGETKR